MGLATRPFNNVAVWCERQLFGLSNLSAASYVLSAHPDKKNDPIAPCSPSGLIGQAGFTAGRLCHQ